MKYERTKIQVPAARYLRIYYIPKWKAICFLFWYCFFFNTDTFSQTIHIDNKIKLYQLHISMAMQHSFSNENDLANKEILIANSFMPIHQWHKKELTYLLKKKFDNHIYYILVKLEFLNQGFSYSYLDSNFTKSMDDSIKNEIESSKSKWQLEYLNNRDHSLANKISEIESIDQFTRNIQLNSIFNCGDSCFSLKKRLIRYSDSIYTKEYFIEVLRRKTLKVESFGESYFSFILIARHILNGIGKDTSLNNLYKDFCDQALMNFFITPDYYANIMDYCFNFKFDENGIRKPTNTFGEFMNYRGSFYIDNPETIDIKRGELGLLPLYITVKDPKKLPRNYINFRETKSNKN